MIDLILGVLVSILGVLLLLYRILDNTKSDSTYDKAYRGQLVILAIAMIVGGLIYAFR